MAPSRVNYLVYTHFLGAAQWNVYFKGGQIFSADATRADHAPHQLDTCPYCAGRRFLDWTDADPRPRSAPRSSRVIDPELRRSIVELGMVRSIEISEAGDVAVTVSLTTAGCPIRNTFTEAVTREASSVAGVTGVAVTFDVLSDGEKSALQQDARPRLAAGRRARPGRQRPLHRLGQGRRGQIHADRRTWRRR